MKTEILDINKKVVGEVELAPAVFEADIKKSVVHDVVVAQLAGRRRGTHKTKGRSEVRGGGAKPWKQKGTGRARAGTLRSPLFRGGGVIFGPTPRSYAQNIPKKVKRAALKSALTFKASEGVVTIIDSINFEEPKTKQAAQMIDALGLTGKKILLVLNERNVAVERSFSNIPTVKSMMAAGVNTYDVLNVDNILIVSDALNAIHERLA